MCYLSWLIGSFIRRFLTDCLNAKSSEERVVYKMLNSTETLIQRTTMDAAGERWSCSSPKFKTYLEGVRGKKASESKMGSVVGSGC